MTENTAVKTWQEGYKAYENRQAAGSCPYDQDSSALRLAWLEGWLAAHYEHQGRPTRACSRD